MPNILKIKNLSSGYGAETIIDDISFEAKPGEIVIIIGPNGAGKSTLLRTIVGDIKPTRGTIEYGETDITAMPARQRAKQIAIVDQEIKIEEKTIGEYIMLGRTPHRSLFCIQDSKEDIESAKCSMRELRIEHFANSKLREVSGGEKQLASIAKAMVQSTEILLLDEPTSNLDIANQKKVLDSISRITRERNIVTIMIIHDINLAITYADKIIIINKKKIIAQGPPEEIIDEKRLNEVYETEIEIINDEKSNKKAIIVKR